MESQGDESITGGERTVIHPIDKLVGPIDGHYRQCIAGRAIEKKRGDGQQ